MQYYCPVRCRHSKGRPSHQSTSCSHLEAEVEELVEPLPAAAALASGASSRRRGRGQGLRPGFLGGVLARCILPEQEAPAPVEADLLVGLERCTARHGRGKIRTDRPRSGNVQKKMSKQIGSETKA
jgi:hypothetical protein